MQFLKTNIRLLITRYTTSLFLASFLSNFCWSEWARPISNLTLVCVQALNLDKEWFLNVQLNIIHYTWCCFVNKQAVQKTIKSLLCFALATREWTCLEYQSIYLEYERQIQQKTMLEQGLICWTYWKKSENKLRSLERRGSSYANMILFLPFQYEVLPAKILQIRGATWQDDSKTTKHEAIHPHKAQ